MPKPHHVFAFPDYVLPDLFTLSIGCDPQKTTINMILFTQDVTTAHLPHIADMLRNDLPTILRSKCFNQQKLPFSQEVKHTEIGHLFEHILLEYLCKEKINLGYNEAIFTGLTSWDWNKESFGTFHITIDVTLEEKHILTVALEQAIHLLKKILLDTTFGNHVHPSSQVSSRVVKGNLTPLSSLSAEKQMI